MGPRTAVLDLHVPTASAIHRLAAATKLVALVTFVIAVALTPRHALWAFAVHGVGLAAVVVSARLPVRVVATRMLVITPFLVTAALLPVIGDGERTTIAGLSVSIDGSWAAWNVAAKATLGAVASITLAATTPIPELLAGLSRLRAPATIVAIVAFMFRYLELVADLLARMRTAMVARGHDPRWLWQARPIAASAGVLFVRSYERGERVHQAMAVRCFTGAMPDLGVQRPSARKWGVALVVPIVSVGATVVAIVR